MYVEAFASAPARETRGWMPGVLRAKRARYETPDISEVRSIEPKYIASEFGTSKVPSVGVRNIDIRYIDVRNIDIRCIDVRHIDARHV